MSQPIPVRYSYGHTRNFCFYPHKNVKGEKKITQYQSVTNRQKIQQSEYFPMVHILLAIRDAQFIKISGTHQHITNTLKPRIRISKIPTTTWTLRLKHNSKRRKKKRINSSYDPTSKSFLIIPTTLCLYTTIMVNHNF